MTNIITVANGKGGVGKTCISLSLALTLKSMNYRILLVDCDTSLGNLHLMMKFRPSFTLRDLFMGQATINELLFDLNGISLLPSANGYVSSIENREYLIYHAIEEACTINNYDFVILDTSSGLTSESIFLCSVSDLILMPIENDISSITDSYSLLKVVESQFGLSEVGIVMNRSKGRFTIRNWVLHSKPKSTEQHLIKWEPNRDEANSITRLRESVARFIGVQLRLEGGLPVAPELEDLGLEKSFVDNYPSSIFALAMRDIAKRIVGRPIVRAQDMFDFT